MCQRNQRLHWHRVSVVDTHVRKYLHKNKKFCDTVLPVHMGLRYDIWSTKMCRKSCDTCPFKPDLAVNGNGIIFFSIVLFYSSVQKPVLCSKLTNAGTLGWVILRDNKITLSNNCKKSHFSVKWNIYFFYLHLRKLQNSYFDVFFISVVFTL